MLSQFNASHPGITAKAEYAGSYDDEIALLIVHGILHLMGNDHVDEEEAEAMERRERELLAEFHNPPSRPAT